LQSVEFEENERRTYLELGLMQIELSIGKAEEDEVGDDAQEQDESRNGEVDQRADFQVCNQQYQYEAMNLMLLTVRIMLR
jgi:hypothetical protein